MLKSSSLLLLVLCAASTASLEASDWPEFRGPTGQGISTRTDLPLTWDATNHVAWQSAIPGEGWSSPSLQGGTIFLTTAVKTGKGLSLRALAVNEKDGRMLWNNEVISHEAGAPNIHGKNSHASPTPIASGDRIYVHFGTLGTACLDLEGKVLWRQTSLKYSPVHGSGGSPILVGDALIFSCDGGSNPFVVALHRDTGKILWKTPRETSAKKTFSFSTPLLITVDGKKQVISPGSGAVCAFDPADGTELWRARYGEGYSVIPRPVFGHGLLFVSSGYDRPVAMAVRPGGQGDVTETHVAWSLTKGAPNTPSMVLAGDELYMVSDGGIGTCLNARTGDLEWKRRFGGNFSASPILADNKLFFVAEEGETHVVAPGKQYKRLATNHINGTGLSADQLQAVMARNNRDLMERFAQSMSRSGLRAPVYV